MSNISKNFTLDDGTEETLVASSEDNYELKMNGNYKLSNHEAKKESRLAKKFKGTILGADIGVKSSGFSSVAILATVIALAIIAILYFVWRF